MDVIDSRVRKCEDVSAVIDKKMRTRNIRFEKFIVPLTENNPFEAGEFVKVLRKPDFEKPSNTSCFGPAKSVISRFRKLHFLQRQKLKIFDRLGICLKMLKVKETS